MLLNHKGQQVPATAQNIMNPLIKELKDVDNHKCYDIFKLGTRAKFRQPDGQRWMVWAPAKKACVVEDGGKNNAH